MSELPIKTVVTTEVYPWERVMRMNIDLMEKLCTRDNQGNRLRVEWGEPNTDGTYTPVIHVDYNDNLLNSLIPSCTPCPDCGHKHRASKCICGCKNKAWRE